MKKVLFVVLAAFVMTVAFSSCKDSKAAKDKEAAEMDDMDDEDEDEDDAAVASYDSNAKPEEKLVAVMENIADFLKGMHIKSLADMNTLKEKMLSFQGESEAITNELLSQMQGLSEEEMAKWAANMQGMEAKLEKISAAIEAEGERLEKEAEAAGLDMKELEDLFGNE